MDPPPAKDPVGAGSWSDQPGMACLPILTIAIGCCNLALSGLPLSLALIETGGYTSLPQHGLHSVLAPVHFSLCYGLGQP